MLIICESLSSSSIFLSVLALQVCLYEKNKRSLCFESLQVDLNLKYEVTGYGTRGKNLNLEKEVFLSFKHIKELNNSLQIEIILHTRGLKLVKTYNCLLIIKQNKIVLS